MKKLSIVLAILMMLTMILPCALAQESTYYSLSFCDPTLSVNDETVFDLTGMTVDPTMLVTDGGDQALRLELYGGEDYSYLTSLQVQFSQEGVVLSLDGMSNTYCLSYETLSELLGDDLGFDFASLLPGILANLNLRSTLDSASAQMGEVFAQIGSLSWRWIPVLALSDSISFDENGECVLPVHVSEEESSAFIAQVTEMYSQYDLETSLESVSADGQITVYGSDDAFTSYTVSLSGTLTADGATASYTLESDISDEAMYGTFEVTDESGEEILYTLSPYENENETVTEDHVILVSENGYNIGYIEFLKAYEPETGYQTEWAATVFGEAEDGSEDFNIDLMTFTDYDTDIDHSWAFTFSVSTGDASQSLDNANLLLHFTYNGYDDSGYRDGYIFAGYRTEDESADFSMRVIESRTELDSEEWALSYADSLDIATLSDSDIQSAQMGLMGVLGEVGATLQEQFPEIADLISSVIDSAEY